VERPGTGIVVVAFSSLLTERLLVLHACAREDCDNQVHHHLGRLVRSADAHSTLDGAAIGAALGQLRTGLLVGWQSSFTTPSDGEHYCCGYTSRRDSAAQ